MGEKEIVLKIGVEGGGATIFRTPHADGSWQFHVEGCGMYLDENDDEDWRYWSSEPVQTIQEALTEIAADGSWIYFHPNSVHTEYRNLVWELAQEIAGKMPEENTEMWEKRNRHWRRLCLDNS